MLIQSQTTLVSGMATRVRHDDMDIIGFYILFNDTARLDQLMPSVLLRV